MKVQYLRRGDNIKRLQVHHPPVQLSMDFAALRYDSITNP